MPIQNPNTAIRTALVSALGTATGLIVKKDRIPLNTTPIPTKYIILQSQAKQPTERTKDCYEWLASINIDIYIINTLGYVGGIPIDNYEEQVINAMESLDIPNWNLKRVLLIQSNDLPVDTLTSSIERRVLQYNLWLWQI